MKWSLIPRFRGQTSWGLLESVKRAILAEPKRIYMEGWLNTNPAYIYGPAPACGTQGCIAGWMVTETAPRDVVEMADLGNISIATLALNLLPAEVKHEASDLFTDGSDDYRFPAYPYYSTNPRDRRRYAKEVVANIDKFMQRNKAALKAHRIDRKQVYGR